MDIHEMPTTTKADRSAKRAAIGTAAHNAREIVRQDTPWYRAKVRKMRVAQGRKPLKKYE